MLDSDLHEDVWTRLRAYLDVHPPRRVTDGWTTERWPNTFALYPPATEEQLRQTEEELGVPLPPDLRRLYAEIANGGFRLGPVITLHGAAGGCPEYGFAGRDTLGRLATHSAVQLHPRIEEALLRHPGRYIVVDEVPDGFLCLADIGCGIAVELDPRTGHVYEFAYWDNVTPTEGGELNLCELKLIASSVSAWFTHWLDTRTNEGWAAQWAHATERGPLTSEMVETFDLLDPDVVWHGLYYFGPDWWQVQPADDDDVARMNASIDVGSTDDTWAVE